MNKFKVGDRVRIKFKNATVNVGICEYTYSMVKFAGQITTIRTCNGIFNGICRLDIDCHEHLGYGYTWHESWLEKINNWERIEI